VAGAIADWQMDVEGVVAALLHDVMEDTAVGKSEIAEHFGKPVADLVDGLSKLDKIEFQSHEDAQAENFRKMLMAMARDLRVVLIKLADRHHNLQTMAAVRADKAPSHRPRDAGDLRTDCRSAGSQQAVSASCRTSRSS
jgi:guanosine-3',5'-bis(diphosphate) 3'-pyrophosphohydrolase